MWPRAYANPMIPEFERAKRGAANMPAPNEKGTYSIEMFKEDFPQFINALSEDKELICPANICSMFIDSANTSVLPGRWGDMWRYAAGLYVAHFCTMYLQTYKPGGVTSAQEAATSGQQSGLVSSATMGDTSVSYDNTAVTAGTEKWGTWNATKYGAQLATMARMIGIAGVYVI